MTTRPAYHENVGALADRILDEVGKNIVLGLPLGLGKANHVANELYARAVADRGIHLRILTALTLEPPSARGDLQRRFAEPLNARLFAGYPRLAYADAVRSGALPPNIEVSEFFLLAGRWLNAPRAQQSYVSANYTHAPRYLAERGLNVIAQLVAKTGSGEQARFSLSCNPDVTLDLLPFLAERRKLGAPAIVVGQVNSELPFMRGDASLPATAFDHILQADAYDFPLFGTPRLPISDAEHAIGLRCAALVPDGGTLQLGIGALGDAVTYGLCLRHQDNDVFRETLGRLEVEKTGGALEPFAIGLYGASEMFVEGFLDLYRAGILKREVEDGAILHSGFFVGSHGFYRALKEMPEAERARFRMTAISFVNEVYGQEERKRRDRVHARFINSVMMATMFGAAVSDTLEDGRVVSGVGGQYNFVAQAFALDGARSLMTLPATRAMGGRTVSNILWRYGQTTIPRHLRDVILTEYGVADLRGLGDRDCIAAMLAVADSRFQDELLREAKKAGKIEKGYEIPARFRNNVPERIVGALNQAKAKGYFAACPFGSDFSEEEKRLIPALRWLKGASASKWTLARATLEGFFASQPDDNERATLARLSLDRPRGVKEHLLRALVRHALSRS